MRVVFYLRRSTEEHQIESIDTQRSNCQAFAETLGVVTLLPPIVDSGRSRAEFVKREGLNELRRLVREGRVDAIVVRDETRLGGEMMRTGQVIQEITESGVRLYLYKTGEELRLDTPAEKVLVTLRNYASESERLNTSERTFEGLRRKAEQGFVAGGRCYGYDNVDVREGGRRHVEYAVNSEQAAVVVEIFQLYADGIGLDGIAKRLNARGVASARAGARGTGSWSAGAIRPMLLREKYRGVLVYGERKKGYARGTAVRRTRPTEQIFRQEFPALRIVSDDLWTAVQARMGANAKLFGKRGGYDGHEPKYLLAALGRCAACGGGISVMNRRLGKRNAPHYACSWHKGRGVCDVKTARPIEEVHDAIIASVCTVVDERMVGEVLTALRRKVADSSRSHPEERAMATSRVRDLDRELRQLGNALLTTTSPPSTLLRMMSEREAERSTLCDRLVGLEAPKKVVNIDLPTLEAQVTSRLADFGALLARNVAEGRRLLQTMLARRLDFVAVDTPSGERWRVDAEFVA